ncbi:hypothetical protein Syn6312_0079 [Synechococcus sp. PCC 6312]|nr:hypothetical protein Syn6312_0079 [Synechococcus sp. PCC 6312]
MSIQSVYLIGVSVLSLNLWENHQNTMIDRV